MYYILINMLFSFSNFAEIKEDHAIVCFEVSNKTDSSLNQKIIYEKAPSRMIKVLYE